MSLLLVAILVGVVLGVIRGFVHLAFGPRALAFVDTAWWICWSAFFFAQTEFFWGGLMLFFTGISSLGFLPKQDPKAKKS